MPTSYNKIGWLERAMYRARSRYHSHATPQNRIAYMRLKAAYKRELFKFMTMVTN